MTPRENHSEPDARQPRRVALAVAGLTMAGLATGCAAPAATTVDTGARATSMPSSVHPARGTLTGRVLLSGGPMKPDGHMALDRTPAPGWTVVVKRGGTVVATTVSDAHGRFAVELPPGAYTVTGCGGLGVVVRPGSTTRSDLSCDVP